MSVDNKRGSVWRKWDLQVQTILDDGYVSISEYADELKSSQPEEWNELCSLIGSEELVIKYDSKNYFYNDSTDDENARSHNYARLFIGFLEVFHKHEEVVVCLTDHNYYHDYLIDALLKVSEGSTVSVLPGVEINVGGVHQLVVFNEKAYGKATYADTIKFFLSQIGVNNAKTDDILTVSSRSYEQVIHEVQKCGAFLMYAHCNSTKGLFQERGKTDRTYLANNFNFQEINILQARTKASADSTTAYIETLPALKSGHVFTLGSDARSLQDILKPDNAGNLCWIKADPTFFGLMQITYEGEARVFIGDTPPIIKAVAAEPTRFIDRVTINQVAGYDESTRGVWFDGVDIPLNQEMVAIVGNKGSGKSALADIIGLVGESKNMDAASFLNTTRFKRVGLAKNFEAEITWCSSDTDKKSLFDDIDITSVEKVKYLPQRWFEELTNDIDGRQFSGELEKVVYTHLDDTERLGYDSFAKLLEYKTSSVADDIAEYKDDLHEVNERASGCINKLHPNYLKEINAKLEQKKRELEAHMKTEPFKVENPDKNQDETQATSSVVRQIQLLDTSIESIQANLRKSIESKVAISRKIQNLASFKEEADRIKRNISEVLSSERVLDIFGEQSDELVQVTVNEALIQQTEQALEGSLKVEEEKLLTESEIKALGLSQPDEKVLLESSLQVQLESTVRERDALREKLEKPQEQYQKYLEQNRLWEYRKKVIQGNDDEPAKDTINYYLNEIENIKTAYPEQLKEIRAEQKEISAKIYHKKKEVVKVYESVKSKVDAVIAANRPSVDDYSINIEAGFVMSSDFRQDVLSSLNLRARGSFMGKEAGYAALGRLIDEKNLDTIEDLIWIQDEINSQLEQDIRAETREDDRARYIGDQVGDIVQFYDYLYGLDYLNENYQLRLDNKSLESLSPGEKGALLLVFYLMLDQDNIPLIIDQPEDNLDNQSVARILVKFIKTAKQRRQIILVTHNPNLAIVADAEQVIYTHFDKNNNHTFTAVSGSIEDTEINKHIVDVLEGTMPAFDKRRLRYLREG